MSGIRHNYLDRLSDDELLALTRTLSDEIDDKLRAFKRCKEMLEERGWQFVNWPDYEKATL